MTQISRFKLKSEILKKLADSVGKTSFLEDTKKTIERETKRADKTYRLNYDVLGIENDEYFFQKGEHIYCYHSIYDSKFDGGSFTIKEVDFADKEIPTTINLREEIQNNLEESLKKEIIDGLATFLVGGLKTFFLWLDPYKLTKNDFIKEVLDVKPNQFAVETTTPPKYLIIDIDKSQNIDFLYASNCSLLLKNAETQLIQSGDTEIRIIPMDELFKKTSKF